MQISNKALVTTFAILCHVARRSSMMVGEHDKGEKIVDQLCHIFGVIFGPLPGNDTDETPVEYSITPERVEFLIQQSDIAMQCGFLAMAGGEDVNTGDISVVAAFKKALQTDLGLHEEEQAPETQERFRFRPLDDEFGGFDLN